MSDQFASTLFVEMAVQRGLRTPDGEWTEKDTAKLATLARQAFRLSKRIATAPEDSGSEEA